MSGFKTTICQGIAFLLTASRDALGDADLASLSFTTRVSREPDLPGTRIECSSAPENAFAGIGLYDAEVLVTLESSLDEDDEGDLHEKRLRWVEGVLCDRETLKNVWPEPSVRVQSIRIIEYGVAESEGRRADSVTLSVSVSPVAS